MKSFTPVVSNNIKNYKNTQIAFLSKEVTVSLAQEYDLSYKSLVKPGDVVKEGEIIAKAGDSLTETTYIHSPVPGNVLEILPCYSPSGRQNFGIKIKTGGAFSYLGKKLSDRSKDFVNNSNYIQKLIDKGVINTFKTSKPVNLGLQIKNNPKAKNLIVRLFDDDPYRITDSLMAKFYVQEIIQGAEVLSKAMNASGIVFAIDQKYENPDVFKEITIPNFRVLEMNIKRYPCGTPREIVSAFFRSGLKKDSNFEITKNDLFVDASTIYEVYKALCYEIPSISKHVHFSGNCLYASCLLDVKIGTPLKDIINQLGGLSRNPAMIIINGQMCGTSVQSLDVPITKYVKSVDFISNYRMTDNQVYSCVNCGNCRFACPVKLSPDILYNNTVNFKFMPENFAASSIACIECGLCNTVCPSRLPLSQTVSLLKDKYLSTE